MSCLVLGLYCLVLWLSCLYLSCYFIFYYLVLPCLVLWLSSIVLVRSRYRVLCCCLSSTVLSHLLSFALSCDVFGFMSCYLDLNSDWRHSSIGGRYSETERDRAKQRKGFISYLGLSYLISCLILSYLICYCIFCLPLSISFSFFCLVLAWFCSVLSGDVSCCAILASGLRCAVLSCFLVSWFGRSGRS
jgi:hypothetical protein